MSNIEVKLQSIRVACEVLGVYSSAANAGEKPTVDEVIKKAQQVYNWLKDDNKWGTPDA
jgi:hypothetical protein